MRPLRTIVCVALAACLLGCKEPIPADMSDRANRLRNDVTQIADTIGERHIGKPEALERTAAWIENRLSAVGTVTSEPFEARGVRVRNLYIDLPGTRRPDEILIIGAHYDSVAGSPAANDNGTGVAALLELADTFKQKPRDRTLRFVAFTNEEPPFFQTPLMGSLIHADGCRKRNEKIIGMLSIETIGCFSDKPGSQKYPPGIPLVLPTVGNYIGVVGDIDHKPFVDRVTALMKSADMIPVESASLPAQLPGVSWSDHWSFWQVGIDAVMITDTAPFRYAHYHKASDTPDKIDYVRMTKVVDALEKTIEGLADDRLD